ncbi:MAG: nucleotidyltransferase domain-containing protein [Actinobacteria bacterium]|nr:nucleotidyltransferase domain-containing protein [Actinomycetota bacterium]
MNQEIFERLQKISDRLKRKYNAEKVILFGSYSTGQITEDSDLDLLIVAPTNEKFFERIATVLGLVRDLYMGLAISPIVLKPDEVSERLKMGDQFIKEVVEKGVEI